MKNFDINDKIRVKSLTRNLTGVIRAKFLDPNSMCEKYIVKFDDKDLLPPEMDYFWSEIEHIDNSAVENLFLKCECGVDFLGMGIHSDWCPKYHKDFKGV